MRRVWLAIAVNLVVPGSGMIVLRREWLGLAVALLFAVFAQIAVFGMLIVPQDVPRWAAGVATVGTIGVWLVAQWLVVARVRVITSPELERELSDLRRQAREALGRQDHAEAHRVLLVALDVNDEDVESLALWAELMGEMGRRRAARRGWRKVLALERHDEQRQRAREALASL